MNWTSASEIVAGLVLDGQLSAGAVPAGELQSPFDKVVAAVLKGHNKVPVLIDQFGNGPIAAAQGALEALNGHKPSDWLDVLHKTYIYDQVANRMEADLKKLRHGEAPDPVNLLGYARQLNTFESEFQTLDQITAKVSHFQRSYYEPVDKAVQGLPDAGVLTVAGLPKTGKTSLFIKLVEAKARHKEHVIVFSFEMPPDEWKARFQELCPKMPAALMKYVHVYTGDEALNVAGWEARAVQMAAEVGARVRLIVVDIAEMLIDGKPDESAMTYLWKAMSTVARRLRCCVLAAAQFNDGAFGGSEPRPRNIRYGRMIVAYSAAIWCIHNPNMVWATRTAGTAATTPSLPAFPGRSYIIAWICRYGFGKEPDGSDRESGAMLIDWSGSTGWGTRLWDYVPMKDIS